MFSKLETKTLTSALFWKTKERIFFSQISLEFAFTYRRANTFIKILKLHGKWYRENHFRYVFNNKIVAPELLASLTAFF